jgi:molybdopterin-guanine dinucleotide biosynthesis protein A
VTLRDVSQNAPEESLFSAHADAASKMPSDQTVAVVSDIPEALEAARTYGIAALPLNDTEAVVDFVAATYVRPRITVVIQAGGESKRMGQSKATVPFSGRPLICRMVERLAPAADELIITTNEADRLAFLKDEFPSLSIRLIPDEYNERGALPGLYTALKAATNSYVAVVACDMVFASPRLVVAEAIALHKHAADIVVPYNKHGYEPLHAVYRKETCIGPVKQRVDEGNKRVQSFFEDESLELFRFTHEMVAEVEPRGGCFVNVNTPDELNHILRSFGD